MRNKRKLRRKRIHKRKIEARRTSEAVEVEVEAVEEEAVEDEAPLTQQGRVTKVEKITWGEVLVDQIRKLPAGTVFTSTKLADWLNSHGYPDTSKQRVNYWLQNRARSEYLSGRIEGRRLFYRPLDGLQSTGHFEEWRWMPGEGSYPLKYWRQAPIELAKDEALARERAKAAQALKVTDTQPEHEQEAIARGEGRTMVMNRVVVGGEVEAEEEPASNWNGEVPIEVLDLDPEAEVPNLPAEPPVEGPVIMGFVDADTMIVKDGGQLSIWYRETSGPRRS
jgi:hypothetical protein